MKLWPVLSIFLIAQQSILLGQKEFTHFQQADEALASGLWEIAELHYKECLTDTALPLDLRVQMTFRLAESLIRSGNSSEALSLLDLSSLARNPETPFWKALALSEQNRLSAAVELLSSLLTDTAAPHRREAGFTLASLLLALDQPEAALATLTKLVPQADPTTLTQIQLAQTEILLDLKRTSEARQILPKVEAIAPADRPLAEFLSAQLLLNEGEHLTEAKQAFQKLINHPQGQSLLHYHAAAIGLADAIQASGQPQVAAQFLLNFLQDHTDSPLLDAIFSRILDCLPLKPSATDPSLERIAQWITPSGVPALGPIAISPSTGAIWPSFRELNNQTELQTYCLYTRAMGLHRLDTPESRAEAKRLLFRLRVENPNHILASKALYQQARWFLDAGDQDSAFSILDTLQDISQSPSIKGEAVNLKARIAYQNGNTEQANRLFEQAALSLKGNEARIARRHAALANLRSKRFKTTTLIQQQSTLSVDKTLEADLQLEQALFTTPSQAARTALEEFITHFPNHPRIAEARVAAAEAALNDSPPDLEAARTQLGILTASVENPASPQPDSARLAIARLRLADLSHDPKAALTAAKLIMETYPAEPAAAEAAFTCGRNLFQLGKYNDARLILENLAAAADTHPARAQAAWLLAARAATLVGTPQSKEDALILFDKAIAAKGPISSLANLEKASHLIDIYRLAEASIFLKKWLQSLSPNDSLQLPAGLLLGEALYAQGSSNPASLVEALAVYDQLLARAKNQPTLLNRLQYLRGTTLEQLPDEKDPTKKRDKQAFQAYHSVLETTTQPLEWEYFERCGFRALALLEKAQRWPVAITVAQKIASFKGPRAEEAANRASQIQLKQMIWED